MPPLPPPAQVPSAQAVPEQDWDYAAALTATSLVSLEGLPRAAPALVALRDAAFRLEPPSVALLGWPAQVKCTTNFLRATSASVGGPLNDYLRPVGELLVLPSGEALLLSEREAEAVLLRMWRAGAGRGGLGGALLVPLCYARQAAVALASAGAQQQPVVPLACSAYQAPGGGVAVSALCQRLASPTLVAVQLFNGETGYGGCGGSSSGSSEGGTSKATSPLMPALRALVSGRKSAAEALVRMRGKGVLFDRSDLELACE